MEKKEVVLEGRCGKCSCARDAKLGLDHTNGPRRANNAGAAVGATIGLLVILWMTFTPDMEGELGWFRSPFHSNMITVIGTLSIFLVGLGASRILGRKRG